MLIYVHGFNSSGQSAKASQLRDWLARHMPGEPFLSPDLPHRPAEALALLDDIISGTPTGQVKLVGSSLGGFYATVLSERLGVKSALINPAVRPHLLLKAALGPQRYWHSDQTYEFTHQHLAELAAVEPASLQHPERLFLLVETGDEVLDYRDAVAYYSGCRQKVVEGGNHSFQSFAAIIPDILAF